MTPSTQKLLLPNLAAGLISGLLQIFMALSFATLIFSGDLAPYFSQGIGLALMGMIITGLIIAAFTAARERPMPWPASPAPCSG